VNHPGRHVVVGCFPQVLCGKRPSSPDPITPAGGLPGMEGLPPPPPPGTLHTPWKTLRVSQARRPRGGEAEERG